MGGEKPPSIFGLTDMIFNTALFLSLALQTTKTPDIPPSLLSLGEFCRHLSTSSISVKADESIADRVVLISLRPRSWSGLIEVAERGLGLKVSKSKEGWVLAESEEAVRARKSLMAAYDELHLGRFRSAAGKAWQLHNQALRTNISEEDFEGYVSRNSGEDPLLIRLSRSLMAGPSEAASIVRGSTAAASRRLAFADYVESFESGPLATDSDPVARLMANFKLPKPQSAPDLGPETSERLLSLLDRRRRTSLRLSLSPLSEELSCDIAVQFGARADYLGGGSSVLWPIRPASVPKLGDVFRKAGLDGDFAKRSVETTTFLSQAWATDTVAFPIAPRSLSIALLAWAKRSEQEVAMWSPGWRDVADPFLASPSARECSLAQLLNPKPRVLDVIDQSQGVVSRWNRQCEDYRLSQRRDSSWTISMESGVCVIRDERAFLDGFVERLDNNLAGAVNRASRSLPTLGELVAVARSAKLLPQPLTAFNDLLGLSVLPCLRAMSGFSESQIRDSIQRAEKEGEARVTLTSLPAAVLRKAAEDAVACSKLLKLGSSDGQILARALQSDYAAAWRASTLVLKATPLPSGSVDWNMTVVAPADKQLSVTQLNPKSAVLADIPLWSGHLEASRTQ